MRRSRSYGEQTFWERWFRLVNPAVSWSSFLERVFYQFFHKEFAMGKTFWLVLSLLGFGLFASIFVTYAIEEYRWQRMIAAINQLVELEEETKDKTDKFMKIITDFYGEGEFKEGDTRKQRHEEMRRLAHEGIEGLDEGVERVLDYIPTFTAFFQHERKTNVRNVLFALLSLVFTIFVMIAAVKTKKRLSREAAELVRQRSEMGASHASLVDREKKLRRQQDRLLTELKVLEEKRETFDHERRRFRREKKKSQHQRPQSGSEVQVADRSQDGLVTQTKKEANVPLSVETEAEATTLAPWKFWMTFSENDDGLLLPQEKDQFIKVLESILKEAHYPELNMELVFKRFLWLIKRLERSQRIGQVHHGELDGWTKFKVTRKHRFFLVRTGEREARFIPIPRKEAYRRR